MHVSRAARTAGAASLPDAGDADGNGAAADPVLPQRPAISRRSRRLGAMGDPFVLRRVLSSLYGYGSGYLPSVAEVTSPFAPTGMGLGTFAGHVVSEEPSAQWGPFRLAAATLPVGLVATPVARERMRHWCTAWSLPASVTDDAAVVVTELVGNAIVHGCGPVGLVAALLGHNSELLVDVYDAGPLTAAMYDAITRPTRSRQTGAGGISNLDPTFGDLATGGRGLAMVCALSQNIAVLPHRRSGKTVRAVLAVAG